MPISRAVRVACDFLLFLLTLSNLTLSQATPALLPERADAQPFSKAADFARNSLTHLNEHGISFQAMLVYDWSKSLEAGTDTDGGFGRYSLDVSMPVDGKKLFGLEGNSGLVRLKQHMRHFGETDEDEAQVYSNIDAASRTMLYEMWIQQRFWDQRIRLKAGKIDATTEFATVNTAGDFLNSSMGFSPTILAFPTYPIPKPGIAVSVTPRRNYGVGIGVFQTQGWGAMSIVEPARNWAVGSQELAGRASIGYWRLDGPITRLDGSNAADTYGLYSVVEQAMWHKSGDSGSGLSGFLQFGWADGRVSCITRHFGGGAVFNAPSRQRRADSIGVAATWVKFSSEPAAGYELPGELTLESYYKATISKHAAVVADFQYFHHPGGMVANRDYPVLTPRLVLSY